MSNENPSNIVIPAHKNTSTQSNNMSGKGASYTVPVEVAKRFNWGAFALDWIWGLGNKSYITLITIPLWLLCFVPQLMLLSSILSFGLSIWFGIKGNEWAWQNKHFVSIEAFHNYQRKWSIAGITYIIISMVIIPAIIIALTLPVLSSNTFTQHNNIAKSKALNSLVEVTMMNEALKERCELSSVGLAQCFEKLMVADRNNNILSVRDGSIWTFYGNGRCKNNGDCAVKIEIRYDGKSEVVSIPLYVNSKGFIRVDEKDLKTY